ATLLMLPTPVAPIYCSKLCGAMMASFPGLLFLAAASFLTEGGLENTSEFLGREAGWFFLAHFLLVPHLAMVLALNMRWGCVPLAIALAVGCLFGTVSIFETIRIGPSDKVVGFVGFLIFLVCVGCHFWIIHRLP